MCYFSIAILLLFNFAEFVWSQPNIPNQNLNVVAENGRNITLECFGKAGTRCVWTKELQNGSTTPLISSGDKIDRYVLQDIPTRGACSLSIRNTTVEDSGILKCKIEPSSKFAYIWNVQIGRKPDRPIILYKGVSINDDRPHEIDDDEPAELVCIAPNGKPAAKVTWILAQYDEENTTLESNGLLTTVKNYIYITLNSSDSKPERTVSCRVDHAFLKQPIIVAATVGLHYDTQNVGIRQKNVLKGQLKCEGDGIPRPFFYQWRYRALNSKDWALLESQQLDTITIRKSGFYECLAKNSKEIDWVQSSDDFFASEVYVNQIKERDLGAEVGKDIHLECKGSRGILCFWNKLYQNGIRETIINSRGYSKTWRYQLTNLPKQGDCSLTIRQAAIEDSGNLICKIYPNTQFTIIWDLTVGTPTTNVTVQSNGSNEIGKAIFCNADGKPLPNIKWQKKVYDGNWTTISVEKSLKVVNYGEYRCQAANLLNGDQWISSTVEIFSGPKVYPTKTVNIIWNGTIVTVGEDAVCEADGNPPPEFRWLFKSLDNSMWRYICDNQTVTLVNNGTYICEARNYLNSEWVKSSNRITVGATSIPNEDSNCTMKKKSLLFFLLYKEG